MTEENRIKGELSLSDVKIGIAVSRFNSFVVDRLLDAALDTLKAAGLGEDAIVIVRVPGAFELPLAAQRLIRAGSCDAVIALGAIIRGETPHFEYISNECARGLAQVALEQDTPVIFGVLTVDNSEQALDRAGAEESNKGAEAAQGAIDMINALNKI